MMQEWFRKAKLGIFIHYGIYAVVVSLQRKSKKCRMADRLFLCFGKFERASERCEDFDRCDGIGSLSY